MRAQVDGTVQQLTIHTLDGIVTPAQQLMVIVPKGTGLEIEAALLNKDVGFVHNGQPVEIKVEAFTFTRYGLLHGTVSRMSQDVLAPDDVSSDRPDARIRTASEMDTEGFQQAREPTYMAHVTLATQAIWMENGFTRLEPGMAVTAEIKTGRRTVISYLLSPLSRFQQESLMER